MKIKVDECCLILVDIQEKLIPSIFNKEKVLQTSIDLIDIAKNLEIPILITEQYPKGLGDTFKDIKKNLPKKNHKIEKTTFSCFGSKYFQKTLESLKRKQIIIAGIETHICVLQTVLDLKDKNYGVFLVEGGIGSRNVEDHDLGIQRMLSSNVHLTNLEMLIFELVRDSKHKLFKYFSKKYIK